MRSRSGRAGALAVALVVSACATTTAPPRFLPDPEIAGRNVHGGWIEIQAVDSSGRERELGGELLAVSPDSIWLTTRPDSLAAPNAGYVIARGAIRTAKLTWWSANPANIGALTLLGVLSTVTNGFVLILTAPAWIATGTIAGARYTYEPRTSLGPPAHGGPELRSLTRFPVGMPSGLDRSFTRLGAPPPKR